MGSPVPLPLLHPNVTLFGNSVCRSIKLSRPTGEHLGLSGLALNPMISILTREKADGDLRQTRLQTKELLEGSEAGGGRGRMSFPGVFGGSATLLTSCFETSGFQNCEGIISCCFEPLCLWFCVMAAPGNRDGCRRRDGNREVGDKLEDERADEFQQQGSP